LETALTGLMDLPARGSEQSISAEQFDAVMRQHQHRVYRVLWMLLRDADEANTLTQECFFRAYQNWSGFRGDSSIETWLLKIAVNLSRDHTRNRKRAFWKKLLGLEEQKATQAIATTVPSPERSLLAREEMKAVWQAAEGLSEQQRAVFTLRFVEDMQLQKIANVLGLKVGTVKTHLFRATTTVRKRLEEQQWR